MEHRFDSLDSNVNSKIEENKSTYQEFMAAIHRIQAIIEEQRSENKIILEGFVGYN